MAEENALRGISRKQRREARQRDDMTDKGHRVRKAPTDEISLGVQAIRRRQAAGSLKTGMTKVSQAVVEERLSDILWAVARAKEPAMICQS